MNFPPYLRNVLLTTQQETIKYSSDRVEYTDKRITEQSSLLGASVKMATHLPVEMVYTL